MKAKDDTNEVVENAKSYQNKTYQIPLFQTRYVSIKINPDELYQNDRKTKLEVVGFKFQVQSTDPRVVNIQKEIIVPAKTIDANNSNNILLEDLFILPGKNARGHIFNAYPSPTLIDLKNPSQLNLLWSIETTRMDQITLTITLDVFHNDDSTYTQQWHLKVLVSQPKRLIDKIFIFIMPFLVILISIQMGILLDTKVLIDLVRRPKAVLIGFISQFGLMPFLAVGIAKLFNYTPLYSLALFVIGCCPGSGASNQWTLLFDGDVNLSAVMSFVSTASSFVMMPLYFYTLGRIYTDKLAIRVPFLGLVRTLALVVVPYSIGIVISHYSPRTRSIIEKLVKPMMLFLLIFFLIFGSIVNWYLLSMIDIYTALTAPLLPYLGFICGALLAYICGLEWAHVKTIGIEAGIQNVGIAFMIIFYSFPQPYATQAVVVPLVVAFLTTKPLWLIYVIRSRVMKYRKGKELHADSLKNGKPSVNEEESTKKEDIAEMLQNL
ncbi:unnamed protein product [Adineta ricciae]|uniref:Uncharacterized protein n=1 Tax=Adineta ricciae TaxID=249248 RepID=A0A814CM51_ADIRI|nr:unnamed protein product [Adineta ricciae]CAF1157238.1 unnamed protein product [Adineta ricciae]